MEIVFDEYGKPTINQASFEEIVNFAKLFNDKNTTNTLSPVNSTCVSVPSTEDIKSTPQKKQSNKKRPEVHFNEYDLDHYYSISEIVTILGLPFNYYGTLNPLIKMSPISVKTIEDCSPKLYLFSDVIKVIKGSKSKLGKEALKNIGIFTRNTYTLDQKEKVLAYYEECHSISDTANAFPNIPFATISTWIKKKNKVDQTDIEKSIVTPEKIQVVDKTYETELQKWKMKQYHKISEKNLNVGKTCSYIFKHLTIVYGINWLQLKKEFYQYYQTSSKSTIELAYFLDHAYNDLHPNGCYQNLFENNLDNFLSKQNPVSF